MALTIVAFLTTLILNIAVGVAVFFFLVLAMNGFSESDANPGFVTYIFLAVIVTLVNASLAVATAHSLSKHGFGALSASLIGIASFTVVGMVLKVVCGIIGVLVANFVRMKF